MYAAVNPAYRYCHRVLCIKSAKCGELYEEYRRKFRFLCVIRCDRES